MKILFVIAKKDFRDEEYFIPKQVFEQHGFNVITSSTEKGTCVGSLGRQAESDIVIDEAIVDDYSAIVIAGGPGALELADYSHLLDKINEFNDKNKVVAAICISAVILAKSGVLKNKEATVWVGGGIVEKLTEGGAEYVPEDVVVDENIVTGNGPDAAEEFAKEIINLLK